MAGMENSYSWLKGVGKVRSITSLIWHDFVKVVKNSRQVEGNESRPSGRLHLNPGTGLRLFVSHIEAKAAPSLAGLHVPGPVPFIATVVAVLQGVDGLVSDPSFQSAEELAAVYAGAPRIIYLFKLAEGKKFSTLLLAFLLLGRNANTTSICSPCNQQQHSHNHTSP